jgi:hypothetical protein
VTNYPRSVNLGKHSAHLSISDCAMDAAFSALVQFSDLIRRLSGVRNATAFAS